MREFKFKDTNGKEISEEDFAILVKGIPIIVEWDNELGRWVLNIEENPKILEIKNERV